MNRFLEKLAKQAPEKEKPHVERALAKLEKEKGVLVDHSVGSGKTRLFLKAVERAQAQNKDPNARSLIVAPASLVTNIEREVEKHKLKIDLSKVDAMSYEKAVNSSEKLRKNKYLIAIADEGHRLRNPGTRRHNELSYLFADADKRLIATATPSFNHASDIAPLVNLAAGREVLPEGRSAFEKEYVYTGEAPAPLLKRIMGGEPQEVHTLRNTKKLGEVLNKYVDHYNLMDDPEAAKHFPKKTENVIKVKMSPTQMGVYKYYENALPWHLKLKVRSGLPLNKRDTAALNMYSQAIRQTSNSIKPFMPQHEEVSPKLLAAVSSVEKRHKASKQYKGLVYSNYMNAGVTEYANELKKRGIDHSIYHGGLNPTQKDAIVDKFNNSDKHVLLVTSSGAEGLNLKGTRHVQILEPHFNRSKVDQIIGRATRYKSHDHLPEKDRTVDVEHFQSTFPDTIFGKSKDHAIDEYLHHNSQTKDDLSQEIRRLIKNK
jgi:SNF2 family DNA or RNA helicase